MNYSKFMTPAQSVGICACITGIGLLSYGLNLNFAASLGLGMIVGGLAGLAGVKSI